MASSVVWLSTFPDEVRYRDRTSNRRHFLNSAALTHAVHRQLQDEAVPAWASTQAVLPTAAVIGAVRLVPDGVYHHLLGLESSEREQYHLWQQQLECNTVGILKCFRVLDVCLLREATPLQQCGDSRLRGFVVPLEAGQPDLLAAALEVEPGWLRQGQALPVIALRLTAPHAVLVGVAAWSRIWLPDLEQAGTRGRWAINWKALGLGHHVGQHAVPAFAVQRAVPLEAKVALEIADVVRDLAAQLLLPRHVADANVIVDLQSKAYKAASSLQLYFDECSHDGLAPHELALSALQIIDFVLKNICVVLLSRGFVSPCVTAGVSVRV
jgi:hypothetical protein